jgi:cation-transporting P-type ATPase E
VTTADHDTVHLGRSQDAAALGLTTAEVADRRARGLLNIAADQPSRTVVQIARTNICTRFNAILGAMFAVILVVGPLQDAMFGLVLVVNTGLGIFQEVRAKRALDSVAVVTAPSARVVRDGVVVVVPPSDIVVDDVIELAAGDGIVVDGDVVAADGLELDESLLTGESEPVAKPRGARLLSGSFVTAGAGRLRATDVGGQAYGARLAAEARQFTLVRSELRDGINKLLRGITWVLVPTAVLLAWSQLSHTHNITDAVRGSVAGTVTMVPEGLVLLTSVAFAVGVIRLARIKVVVRELPALEGLARVDVLCIDKTGTLTTGELTFEQLTLLDASAQADARVALASIAAAEASPNSTIVALRAAFPPDADTWRAVSRLSFSSARKYSGADFGDRGSWLLGAPDVLLRDTDGPGGRDVEAAVADAVRSGRRVLLLARASALPELDRTGRLGDLTPVGLVVLTDVLRTDAQATLGYLAAQGVRVKIISGDHPFTVAAIATQLGLATVGAPVDARTLPDSDGPELRAALEAADVFGRVTPHQKRAFVEALQGSGHTVAMTGDGVNDVLALKAADLGIAMGSGTSAARMVSQLVLLDDAFSAVPTVVAEGRRVIANVERVANLFLTKTVYATVLALTVGVVRLPFPFLPRHLTLVSALTIGIPGFFLALAPNAERARTGFISRVLRFAAPAGLVAAAATFAAYSLARSEPSTSLESARTVATLVLAGVALWVLSILARPATRPRQWLIASMVGLLVAALALPWTRTFFALTLPRPVLWLAGVGVAGLAGLALEGGWLAAGSIRVVSSTAAGRLAARRRAGVRGQGPTSGSDGAADAGE